MPFCSKCGTQVEAGSGFCHVCGAPIVAQPASSPYAPPPAPGPYQSAYSPYAPAYTTPISSQSAYSSYAPQVSMLKQQEFVRTDSLSELNRMISHFNMKQQQYDEYDHCLDEIERLSKPNARVKANTGVDGTLFLTLGIVFTAILYVVTFILAFSGYWGIAIGTFCFLLVSILLLIFGARLKINNNRILKETRLARLKEAEDRFESIAKELYQHYVNYGYCPTSPSYTNPKILEKIRENIWNGRADTIKESINLLHQDAHNSEMELQAKLTARYSASAARSARTAAFFTAANFFLK